MSFQITEAFVKQYSSNVFHLSQQKGSRLRSAVRNESQVGKSAFYDRIGRVAAQLRTTRHGDTPRMDTPHDRRKVDLFDYEWADLVDDQDKIRMLMDPTSQYAQAAAWALGRSMDERIIKALGGAVTIGEEGTGSSIRLPYIGSTLAPELGGGTSEKTQRTVCYDDDGAAASSLTVYSLRKIKRILDGNDVDPGIRRYIVVNAAMLDSMLGELEVTSSDYASVKALVQGEVNTFMGFEFIRTELLPKADDAQFTGDDYLGPSPLVSNLVPFNPEDTFVRVGGSETVDTATQRVGYAWAMDGCLCATGQDITGEIARRADKSFATQVYAKMSIGAVRMEEEKVVQFLATE